MGLSEECYAVAFNPIPQLCNIQYTAKSGCGETEVTPFCSSAGREQIKHFDLWKKGRKNMNTVNYFA